MSQNLSDPSALQEAYHAETDWLDTMSAWSKMDRSTLCDFLACFYRDRDPRAEGYALPTWASDPDSATYRETRERLIAKHGWEQYSDPGVVIHSELMARAEYKVPIHLAWIEALQDLGPDVIGRIVDVGAGASSYCTLARRVLPDAHTTLAEVHPGLVDYLRYKHRDENVEAVQLRTMGAARLTEQHRAGLDLSSIPGRHDAAVLGDVLEHVLDPLGILLTLRSRLRRDGLLMIAYASYIEGDWHTPEAYYLRPWCLRFLARTSKKQNKWCRRLTPGPKATLTTSLFHALKPVLDLQARRFTRRYFRENGEHLCREVAATGRQITVDDLLRSVG